MAQILEFGTRFPAEKPQWEIILLEELPNPHQVGVVFRFHHSYGDGLSFIGALLGMTKEDEFPLVASPFVDHLSGWGRFKLNAFGCAMFGLTLVREMFFVPPPCPRYRHEDGGEGYSTLRFNIPLSKLRTITKRTEQPITISSIMMTSIAAAVARLPTTQAEPFYLKGALVVTNPPYPRGKLCHRFSTLLVSLPQDAHNVTEKTLVEISKSCRSSFNPTAFFTRFLGDYLIGSLPTKICENNPVTNYLVLSNIPFLKKRNVKFAGSTLLDCAAFFHVPNALYVSMISMEDNITVTMTAARTMLNREELDAVAVMLVQQIDSLTSMKSRLPLRKDFEV
ncbi:hypothetical protein Fcan01_15856 [Folsomia candida]|uniref:Uncharacterized protein n=2 Tax=Folsomia candida TaxID=158441 RepID=A0A226DVP5_FOLCA|nr:hypothetical protein Fcan01_15856 [Folsomia candida]